MESISFENQVRKHGMDIPENWKGDPRGQFINVFSPLIDGTEYSFKLNETDKSAKILEVYCENNIRRVAGFAGKQDMSIGIFFNADLYNRISERIELPGNQRKGKSQPHMKITFETLWNVFCVMVNKDELRTDRV